MANPLEGLISAARVPKLFFVDSQLQAESNVVATICRANRRKLVRITGGCGEMSDADSNGLLNLFTEAFAGFDGALLFGGTRMYTRTTPKKVRPGITEIGPAIRRTNPNAVVVGIIAKTGEMVLDDEMIVGDSDREDFYTVVHPDQDVVLVVDVAASDKEKNLQRRARNAEICEIVRGFPQLAEKYSLDPQKLNAWDGEFLQCSSIIHILRTFSRWDSILPVYNGGGTTLKEVVDHVDRGWPTLIVEGSGRVADDIARCVPFRRKYEEFLHFAKPNVDSLRAAVERCQIVEPSIVAEPQVLKFRTGS